MKTTNNEVLFQKLGNNWYAFSIVDGECIYSALPQGVDPKSDSIELYQIVEGHMKKVAQTSRRPAEMAA